MFDIDKKKRDLARDLASCAEWRERQAVEHPGDERYVRAAASLRRAAAELEELSSGDSRLGQLAYFLAVQPDDEVIQLYLADESLAIGRYGFEGSDASLDDLLATLLKATETAAQQSF